MISPQSWQPSSATSLRSGSFLDAAGGMNDQLRTRCQFAFEGSMDLRNVDADLANERAVFGDAYHAAIHRRLDASFDDQRVAIEGFRPPSVSLPGRRSDGRPPRIRIHAVAPGWAQILRYGRGRCCCSRFASAAARALAVTSRVGCTTRVGIPSFGVTSDRVCGRLGGRSCLGAVRHRFG